MCQDYSQYQQKYSFSDSWKSSYLLKFGVVLFQLHQIFNPLFVVLMSHKFSILLWQLNILLTENLVLL